MSIALLSREDIATQAQQLYEKIRAGIETEENIGKMVLIDVETGNYALDDERSLTAFEQLRTRNPNGQLYGIRIGYNVAAALGGVMERISP